MYLRESRLALIAAMALTPGLAACGGEEAKPELPFAQELREALDSGLQAYGGKGIAAAVIVPGYETWVGASGVSHGTTSMEANSMVSAGSIQKNFDAAAILQLVEEDVLALDDPLHKWLPDFPNIDNTITIRQLLNHTSGIYNMTDSDEYWETVWADPDKSLTPEEVLTNFVLEPYFPTGTAWHYSNSGYILLRIIMKEATGSGRSSEFRNRFWSPLGLDNTFLVGEEEARGTIAHGWLDLDGDGAYDDLSGVPVTSFYSGIGGGILSTAEDLAKWSWALYHEREVLSQQSLDQMLDFLLVQDPAEPLVTGYGLGVVEFSPELLNGLEVWGHAGNAPGYAAGTLYLPDYGVSIALATNTQEGEAMHAVNDLLSIITSHLQPAP